jgi:hypothetical protein
MKSIDSYIKSFKEQDELNQKIWDGDKIKPEVKKHLLDLGNDFHDFVSVPWVKVKDIEL